MNSGSLTMSFFHAAIRGKNLCLSSLSEGRTFIGGVAKTTFRESFFLTRLGDHSMSLNKKSRLAYLHLKRCTLRNMGILLWWIHGTKFQSGSHIGPGHVADICCSNIYGVRTGYIHDSFATREPLFLLVVTWIPYLKACKIIVHAARS